MLFGIITVFWQSASDTHLLFKINVLLTNGISLTLERALADEVVL